MKKHLSPRGLRSSSKLLCACAIFALCGALSLVEAAAAPVILTEENSARAVALEAVTFRKEPFTLTMPVPFSTDARNRIVFFVMNLDLLAGEGANALTVDAEDASKRHYAFTVENVTPVAGYEWMSQVTVRLSDDIGDVGDVLVRLNLHGMSSNRVRIAIGHTGGGPPNDASTVIAPAPYPAPQPTPVPTPKSYTGSASMPDTVRFLEQATFGPTPAEITRVQGIGFRAFLEEQFNESPSVYPAGTLMPTDQTQGCPTGSASTCSRDNYTMYPLQLKFYQNALSGQDQLRQRVAWALHQIFVISGRKVTQPSWVAPYLQTLSRNAFGNFRQLLQEITLNPGMGLYLDMTNNTRTSPNENYAREVLQLFTVGPDRLNIDGTFQLNAQGTRVPTYDQTTITNFARVFTGWGRAPAKTTVIEGVSYSVGNYVDPLVVTSENNHDTNQKILLNGTVLPAGRNATQDLNAALDNIFNHPNVGPFIGRQLIQQLVTSNPSRAYVERVARVFENNCSGFYPDNPCTGARGDLKAVVRAILLDPEARGDIKTDPAYGRLREPAQYITNILRITGATSDGYLNPNSSTIDQDVFRPVTVFSYYSAEYVIPGTNLSAPQFGILSTSTAVRRENFVNTILYSGIAPSANAPSGTQVSLASLQPLASSPANLVDELDRLMLHGTMSPGMKTSIVNAVSSVTDTLARTRMAVYLVATSSQYQIAR